MILMFIFLYSILNKKRKKKIQQEGSSHLATRICSFRTQGGKKKKIREREIQRMISEEPESSVKEGGGTGGFPSTISFLTSAFLGFHPWANGGLFEIWFRPVN